MIDLMVVANIRKYRNQLLRGMASFLKAPNRNDVLLVFSRINSSFICAQIKVASFLFFVVALLTLRAGAVESTNLSPTEFLQNVKPVLEGLPRFECYVTRILYQYIHSARDENRGPLTNYYYFRSDGTNYYCATSTSESNIQSAAIWEVNTNLPSLGLVVFGRHSSYFWYVDGDTRMLTHWLDPEPIPTSPKLEMKNEDFFYAQESEATEAIRLGLLGAIPFTCRVGTGSNFTAIATTGSKITGFVEPGDVPDEFRIRCKDETTKRLFLIRLTMGNGANSSFPTRIAVYNSADAPKAPSAVYSIEKARFYPAHDAVAIPDFSWFYYDGPPSILSNSLYYSVLHDKLVPQSTLPPRESNLKTVLNMSLPYLLFLFFSALFLSSVFLAKRRIKTQNNNTGKSGV